MAVARLHVSPSKRCAHRGGVWNIPRCNGRTPRPRVSRRCASERGGSAAGARREPRRDRIFHIEHRYFEVQSFHVDSDNPPHSFLNEIRGPENRAPRRSVTRFFAVSKRSSEQSRALPACFLHALDLHALRALMSSYDMDSPRKSTSPPRARGLYSPRESSGLPHTAEYTRHRPSNVWVSPPSSAQTLDTAYRPSRSPLRSPSRSPSPFALDVASARDLLPCLFVKYSPLSHNESQRYVLC